MLLKYFKKTHQDNKQISDSDQSLCENHNFYITFVKNILEYPYSSNIHEANIFRLNAIDKVLRDLALNEQHYIFQYAIHNTCLMPYSPIFSNKFIKCPICGTLSNCKRNVTSANRSISFDIAHHPAISQPWNYTRLIKTLGYIGSSVKEPFIFDSGNHWGSTYYPLFDLLLIKNGYHSATSGILDTTAIFYPEHICDCSSFYTEIYFDGLSFRHIACDCIIDTPENKSIGTIYEIGRLIHEKNLSFLDLLDHEQAFLPALIRDKPSLI